MPLPQQPHIMPLRYASLCLARLVCLGISRPRARVWGVWGIFRVLHARAGASQWKSVWGETRARQEGRLGNSVEVQVYTDTEGFERAGKSCKSWGTFPEP